mmetsp:Transcript_6969/g.14439  ORF Transcript_6969/g.14439 Transcript_6969/m.14439 type:complete len:151 (+) Transcript_6969:1222-1674(+)
MVGLVRRASPLPLRVRRRFLRAHPQSRAIRSYAIKDIAVGKNEPAVEQPLYRFTTIGSDMSVMQGLRCSVRIRCDAADPSSKSQISWHYRNSLSMYGAKVGVVQEADDVVLSGVLNCSQRVHFPTELGMVQVGDFLDDTTERQPPNQKVC